MFAVSYQLPVIIDEYSISFTVSRQLTRLRLARLVKERREGTFMSTTTYTGWSAKARCPSDRGRGVRSRVRGCHEGRPEDKETAIMNLQCMAAAL